MPEYIDREAAKQAARDALELCSMERFTAMSYLNAVPSADVAPVRHGRWIGLEYDGYADGCPVYDLWECSECGEEVRGEYVPETNLYCHNCGAKMDGGENDD